MGDIIIFRFSWKVWSETVDAATITCFFFQPLSSLLLFFTRKKFSLRGALSSDQDPGPQGVVALNPVCQARVQLVNT